MSELEVQIGTIDAYVQTVDASGAHYAYHFDRDGDTLTLKDREKARPAEAEIPNWRTVTPKVTPTVREALETRGFDVEVYSRP